MRVTVRQAFRADLPHILGLYSVLGEDDGSVLSLAEAETILTTMASYPDYRLYLAEAEGRVVGTFTLLIIDNLAHRGARSAILEDVVVASELRGQGIGRTMLACAARLCREKGCYKIVLSSNRRRRGAHRFYRALGFSRHGCSFSLTLCDGNQ